MADTYDVIVIGGGPGGYVAAIRAAQLGLKTACIDKRGTPGGTCLNIGCIPSKALLQSSEKYAEAQHALAVRGVKVSGVALDLPVLMARKDKVVGENTRGVEFLFKKNKVDYIKGAARFTAPGKLAVTPINGGQAQELAAKSIIIATGSDVVPPPGMDGELSRNLQRVLTKQGFAFRLGTKVVAAKRGADGVALTLEPAQGGPREEIKAEIVLVAIGRRPYTEGLGLEAVGVAVDNKGRITVDHDFATNVKGIYAIGDVIAGAMLAHKASEEGVALAEMLAGQKTHVNYE